MLRARARRSAPGDEGTASDRFAPRDLSALFGAPPWLRDLGASAWLVVGVALFVVATVWVLSLTETIVAPVITAGVIAAVASPLVHALQRRGLARGLGAALVLVGLIVVALAVVVLVLAGVRSQFDGLSADLSAAKDTITGWLTDLGVARQTAQSAQEQTSSALAGAVPALHLRRGGAGTPRTEPRRRRTIGETHEGGGACCGASP